MLEARGLDPSQEWILIQIVDTGAGMSEEVKSKAFEPFFTVKKAQGAAGFGLSIAYEMATNHGGDIIVESEEGRGSAFNVYLPASGGEGLT